MRRAFALVLALTVAAVPAYAQYDRPPDEGGMTLSMGQPPIYKWFGGLILGANEMAENGQFVAYGDLGVSKDLFSPVTGAGMLSLEGYIGARADNLDGGFRGMFLIPFFTLGAGVDYNIRDERLDFVLRFFAPLRRGGIVGRGMQFRIDWIPAREQTLNLGVTVPLRQSLMGRTRPRDMDANIRSGDPRLVAYDPAEPALIEALGYVRETAHWVNRFTSPFIDQGGFTYDKAIANYTESVEEMKTHLAALDPLFPDGRSSEAEVRVYHQELTRAFSIAVSGEALLAGESTALGRELAGRAKVILLDEVIFPYNRLLGVKKKKDTVTGFGLDAARSFRTWLIDSSAVPADRHDAVMHVFQTLVGIVEEERRYSRDQWGDSRLVWIPLQYGLLPEQHDSQAELDAIIERALGRQFTEGNRVWYVVNHQFQWEVFQSIQRAEDYHVLWIHDIKWMNAAGDPDRISFAQMVGGYLTTLVRRVREYDETGKLPLYMIFFDQHYYEIFKSRRWMNLLEDPLRHEVDFPDDFAYMADSLATVQEELRRAVAESRLLQERAAEFGENWLANQIKVHVNITHPADHSFWENQVLPIFGWPDNVMRDHRKIAFYDITEEDPYKGMAIYSGMGIGEHYVGPTWEDRAIMVQGPAALDMKNAARQLLLNQGFPEDQIPHPLKPKPLAPDYDERVRAMMAENLGGARAMEMHSETGYLLKPINVLKAVLYSLAPRGAVVIVPDSLWNASFLASLLVGACMRGARVFIINPSKQNAPGQAFMTLSRAQELYARLIIFQDMMADEIAATGGLLKTGLYNTEVDVANLPGRMLETRRGYQENQFLREVFPVNPDVLTDYYARADEIVAGFGVEYEIEDPEPRRPKLHLKTHLVISAEALEAILGSPAFVELTLGYIEQRALDLQSRQEYRDVRELSDALREPALQLVSDVSENVPQEVQERMFAYFMVGSSNQDYRSMLMDGEVSLVVSGRASLNGLFDFLSLMGGSTWVNDLETLEELLPRHSRFKWRVSRAIKDSL
ncbi:MAG: hypothetical protein JSW46_20025 [Gemmatimonadota bacterium]|nr:MAG: hypothetical protein JSW46_20025 [Gemmatimonadota bacterium]